MELSEETICALITEGRLAPSTMAKKIMAAVSMAAVSPGCRGAEQLIEALNEERRAVQRGSFPPQEMEALFEAVHATDEALKALQAGGPGRGAELAEALEKIERVVVSRLEPNASLRVIVDIVREALAAFRAS